MSENASLLSELRMSWVGDLGEESRKKVQQFGLTPLSEYEGLRTNLARSLAKTGVWAMKDPDQIFDQIDRGQSYNLLVGFKPSRFHAGHITLGPEIAWHIKHGAEPFFVVSGHEANTFLSTDQARAKVGEFWKTVIRGVLKEDLAFPQYVYSDVDSPEIRSLKSVVDNKIKIAELLRLYGWNAGEITMNQLNTPGTLTASFLLPQLISPEKPTLVTADVKQVTHAEITNKVARRLNVSPPSFSYRLLLPSLKSNNGQRMSIEVPNTAVFLGDDPEVNRKKLIKAVSGGRSVNEQEKLGGNPHKCSFFKIADLVLKDATLEQVLQACMSGKNLCGECKNGIVEDITSAISGNRTI